MSTQKLTLGRSVIYGRMDRTEVVSDESRWDGSHSGPVLLMRYTFLPEFASAIEWQGYSDQINFTLEDVVD